MSNLTEQQIKQHWRHHLFTLENELIQQDGKLHLNEQSLLWNDLPGIVHINSQIDGSCLFLNEDGLSFFELSLADIQALGKDYLHQYCHPHTLETIVPQFKRFFKDGSTHKILSYYQHVWNERTQEWSLCFSVKKQLRNFPYYLTISSPLEKLRSVNKEMKRIIGEQKFVCENYLRFQTLSKREIEILRYIAEGHTSQHISEKLSLSKLTVQQHRKNLKKKLAIKSFPTLLKYVYAFGLIKF